MPLGIPPSQPYLIASAVDGLDSGTYRYDTPARALQLLRAGDFRSEAAFLALDQGRAGQAAVNIYFLADMEAGLTRHGERAYRVMQLDAAIRGGRLYLAAYALGLAATGLTFYDDEVIRLFSPAAEGKDVMFLMAIGR